MKAWERGNVTLHVGDALAIMRSLPACSVHCVVTSPPYWGLRNYGVDGQHGSEPTPKEYIAVMVDVFREVRRVLRDDGTLWVNIGDSYTSGGRDSFGTFTADSKQASHPAIKSAKRPGQPKDLKPKDLVGIPWMIAFALRADGWYLRQDIIWAKPNPMPESVRDRCTKAHEYIFLFAKSERYFYDLEAVKEPSESGPSDIRKMVEGLDRYGGKHKELEDPLNAASANTSIGRKRAVGDPSGRNPRSVWMMATQPYSGAHFATFPEKLPERCIKVGTSAEGCCGVCGAPLVRVTESKRVRTRPGRNSKAYDRTNGEPIDGQPEKPWNADKIGNRDPGRHVSFKLTKGWEPTCNCEAAIVPCTVLDCYSGSGTTGAVAVRLGRKYIGIDLSAQYTRLAIKRISEPQEALELLEPLEPPMQTAELFA